MKHPISIISGFVFLVACNNETKNKRTNVDTKPDTPVKNISVKMDTYRDSAMKGEFKTFKIFGLNDTIVADFNGDKILDSAYFSQDKKKEIFIVDGKTKIANKIGSDKSFHDIGSQFDWVDFWGTTNDSAAYEIAIKNGEIIGGDTTVLSNTSLFLRKDEEGGGVITYKKGKYIWVHQAD